MVKHPVFMHKLAEKHEKGILAQYVYERVRNTLNKIGLTTSLSIVFEENLRVAEPPTSQLADCRVDFLASADMPEVAAIEGYDYTSDELADRLKNKSLCIGLKYSDKIVAFTWCDVVNSRHNSIPYDLSESDAFLYDAYTAGEYRGKNLIALVRYYAYQELTKMGRSRFLSTSDFFNTPAIRFKKKLQATPLQLVFYIRLFNRLEKNFVLKTY